jgi:hypothetical protein
MALPHELTCAHELAGSAQEPTDGANVEAMEMNVSVIAVPSVMTSVNSIAIARWPPRSRRPI